MKNLRSLLALVVSATLIFCSAAAAGQAAGPCVLEGGDCPNPTTSGSTFEYQYVDSTATFYKVPTTGTQGVPGDTTTIPQEYFYVPNCPNNGPVGPGGQVDDNLCAQALVDCPDGQIRTRVYQRPVGSATVPTEAGLICVGPDGTITLTDLNLLIGDRIRTDFAERDVGKPALVASPPNLTLVNLPVITSTTVEAKALHITDPLEADVQLTPVTTWDFGDGTDSVRGPLGTPYDGTSALDDPGHYPLTHVYAKPGIYTITLTVLWTATGVTTAQHPAPIPLPGPQPSVTTASTLTLTAHEAHAVLVSGG
jgi:hypothetical protein